MSTPAESLREQINDDKTRMCRGWDVPVEESGPLLDAKSQYSDTEKADGEQREDDP